MGRRLLAFAGILLALGCVPSSQMPTAPGKPITLPVADQAVAAKSVPEATVEIPAQEPCDIRRVDEEVKKRLGEIAEVAEKLKAGGDIKDFAELPITIKADPGAEYHWITMTLLRGRDRGFFTYLIACRKNADERNVGYLKLTLPGGPMLPRVKEVCRLYVKPEGEGVVWELNGIRYDTLAEAISVLKGLRGRTRFGPDGELLVVIDGPGDLPVQRFVDVFNAVVKSGITDITLGRPRTN
jgi:biopolymer transport protein ExbD